MKNIVAVLALALAGAIGCRKVELPPPVTEPPKFSVDFIYGDSAVAQTLTAGLDGLYLFTSHDRDALNVVTMRGAFAPADCPATNCPGTLIFEIRHYETGPVVPQDTTAVVPEGSYLFRSPPHEIPINRLTFRATDPDSLASIGWTLFQDAQLLAQGTGDSIVYDFTSDSTVTVRMTYEQMNGFQGFVETRYRFVQPDCPEVELIAQPDTLIPNNYMVSALTTPPGGNFDYLWNTGSSSPTIFIDSTILEGPYLVTVTSATGCPTSATVINPAAATAVNRLPSIAVGRQEIVIPGDELQLGRVTVRWFRPETGELLRSDYAMQPADSYFYLSETGLYEPNENGEKTNRMRISFRCLLFDPAGNAQWMTGNGVIAVAYP